MKSRIHTTSDTNGAKASRLTKKDTILCRSFDNVIAESETDKKDAEKFRKDVTKGFTEFVFRLLPNIETSQ